VAQRGIREGVARALSGLNGREPYRMEMPLEFGFEFSTTTIAETCEWIPGVRKTNPFSTEFTIDNLPEAMRIIFVQLLIALQVGQKGIYS
jgi:D-aminopeptidase